MHVEYCYHSSKNFDLSIHFLRQDIIFAPPGAHLIIKWTKTLQAHRAHQVIQLPEIDNYFLCPVRALRALLASRRLSPQDPLFANSYPPYKQVIDTHIRDALRRVLQHQNIAPQGKGFHTFRRSGPPWHLITMWNRTLWPIVFGEVQQFRGIFKMHPRLPPLFLLPLPVSSHIPSG